MKHNVEISIVGVHSAGKSFIKYLIERTLKDAGIDVQLVLEPGESKDLLDRHRQFMADHHEQASHVIASKSRVMIRETRTE